ncbi:probable Vacuolar aminopeptidase 1 [Saccharomycodes ludwigii]|uniref:Probable Vacuolar aminopeptidase 1 n=1 Tax=Saccharomycodes ludwigii TaxID=36035 RepID=A0A376B1G9_9ASCO|nr:probable Vacuolar aminopeptidase 1 [Saccharomycodes ludwigii]
MSNSEQQDPLAQLQSLIAKLAATQLPSFEEKVNENLASPVATNNTNVSSKKYDDEYFKYISQEYITFTYTSPTIYHVVQYFANQLEKNGFVYLSEKKEADWSSSLKGKKSGKFYTTRNGTNLAAFIIGSDWEVENGVGAIGSHIDALTAKLKPSSIKPLVGGFELLGVAPYGGTLNDLWFDRDLGIGGRVLYEDNEKSGQIKSALINSTPHPIARIPSLAPHFGQDAVGPFDKETQAVPVIGYFSPSEEDDKATDDEKKSPLFGKHSIHLLRYIAQLANIKVSQIQQLDLDLFDVQKGTFAGIKNDFIIAPRLDDRSCSFSAINALTDYANNSSIDESSFNIVTLYDNEEIGSLSRQGAKGGLMESTVQRVVSNYFAEDDNITESLIKSGFANSFIISADVIHMDNPNFTDVYLENHKPKPNVGLTISLDSNGHMATDVVGTCLVEKLAKANDDKLQYFQIKNNSRSGGTIGPSIASQTGTRTIDMGIAQWSMHSIRASTGSKDVGLAIKFFTGFFKNWRSVYNKFGDL